MRRAGFTLVELVIVVVIVGIIAAIAIPRISRGADGSQAAALAADLMALRNALERYSAEHDGVYPESTPPERFDGQLTKFTDRDGAVSDDKTPPYIFGPYLSVVPKLRVGEGAGNGKGENAVAELETDTAGWIYDAAVGAIKANAGTDVDPKGKAFRDY
ncbi:MAG: prepilin-type N-terminal cleavage/methylation domain-containing protein [Phycisphaerales bacterium]|nr:prepilin-type N-terminal cleavage/methylation domain-containing protein [Phycisphaerales bacterium]